MQEAADASETGRYDEYVVAKNRDDALVKAKSQYVRSPCMHGLLVHILIHNECQMSEHSLSLLR